MLISALKLLWNRWKAFGHWLATIQSRIFLFVFYFVILGPFALVMRMFSDPLRLRQSVPAGWLSREIIGGTRIERDETIAARRQF
jgi:hypothetical protein